MDQSRYKELSRLIKLEEEAAKQKIRCLDLLERDVKLIGVKQFARHCNCTQSYIFLVFSQKKISNNKIRELWEKAYDLIQMFKLEG
jgi:hypothetical protein